MNSDWCAGCASAPENKQVNLPVDWTPGDELPENLTVHWTQRDPQRFAFIGDKAAQNRHYFSARG